MNRKYSLVWRALFCSSAALVFSCASWKVKAADSRFEAEIRNQSAAIEAKIIRWRRDIHSHPELGQQEFRTSGIVADHLLSLGLNVQTNVADTGIIAFLQGAKIGPVVALRADMDALPVLEPEGLPFASKGTQTYLGKETPVMHACGHDAHTAMLMGTAEVLTKLKAQLAGTVMFIFQPAEEGPSMFEPSDDKIWGAKQMIHEGMFKSVKPDAAFAMHVMPGPLGEISYRDGAALAASDTLTIDVIGEQGHGGMPWNTVDPITTSSLIICGLQTIVSRKTDLTASPAVITIGTINGGSRANIVPGSVHMSGTVRTFEQAVREQVQNEITVGAKGIAESQGAHAEITFVKNYDATVNNSQLLERMLPALKRAADGRVTVGTLSGASEDFSEIAKLIPSLYVYLGITPKDQDPKEAAPNHNPNFFVDESALVVGTRVMSTLAADFLTADQ